MRSLIRLVTLSIVLTACSSDGGEAGGSAGPGGEATIGPGGGSLSSASGQIKLEVPDGAVDRDVRFTATDVTEARPSQKLLDADGRELGDETPLGDISFELGPEDVTFATPVRLTLPVSPVAGEDPNEVFLLTRQGKSDAAPTPIAIADLSQENIEARTRHFSTFRKSRARLRPDACPELEIACKSKGCLVTFEKKRLLQMRMTSRYDEVEVSFTDAKDNILVGRGRARKNTLEVATRLATQLVSLAGCKRLADAPPPSDGDEDAIE